MLTSLLQRLSRYWIHTDGHSVFSGDLSAVGGTFAGTLLGVDGNFTGTVSANAVVAAERFTAAYAEFLGTIALTGAGTVFGEGGLELTTDGDMVISSTTGAVFVSGPGGLDCGDIDCDDIDCDTLDWSGGRLFSSTSTPNGTTVEVEFYTGSGMVARQVLVGPTNSGGTGYRALRIDN